MSGRGTKLAADDRIDLLREVAGLHSDADQLIEPSRLLRSFLPMPLHARALDDDVMVVRGGRGAGKSMLLRAMGALSESGIPVDRLFSGAKGAPGEWLVGFAEDVAHPSADVVAEFAHRVEASELRRMWLVHLVGRLVESLEQETGASEDVASMLRAWREGRHEIAAWANPSVAPLSGLMATLDAIERNLREAGRIVVVGYDHLDRIGINDRVAREAATSALLLLWLTLSTRYRQLRAKIFVREDVFAASLSRGADASKLRARSISLSWSTQALYQMLIRQMANRSPELRAWIQSGRFGVALTERSALGWFPPGSLPESGNCSQQGFVEHLVGRQMGKGVNKGYVYRWIPNRLQDAHRVIAPRAFVNLVAYAAETALERGPRAGYQRLLHPLELQAALEVTSKQRADEVKEEHPRVELLETLRGLQLPAQRGEVLRRFRGGPADVLGESDETEALAELLDVGVLRSRMDSRIDVPDVYRYGYGIKRKGGVRRAR